MTNSPTFVVNEKPWLLHINPQLKSVADRRVKMSFPVSSDTLHCLLRIRLLLYSDTANLRSGWPSTPCWSLLLCSREVEQGDINSLTRWHLNVPGTLWRTAALLWGHETGEITLWWRQPGQLVIGTALVTVTRHHCNEKLDCYWYALSLFIDWGNSNSTPSR